MNVTLESSGNLLIAYLFGEIDHHTAVAVRSQIDSAIQDKLPGHLILDFKNVTFMDSSGIGLVMGRYRLVHSYQGTVEIKNVTARTKKIMELADLKTAVSEAVTNCIVHGYKDCCGKIYIHTVLLDPPAVRVTVRDKGCGIVDVPQAMTPLYTTGEGERAGLGFTVMESFCDKLRVTSKPGKGTTVVLEKRITGKQKW